MCYQQVFPSCELVGAVSSAIRVRASQEVGSLSSLLPSRLCHVLGTGGTESENAPDVAAQSGYPLTYTLGLPSPQNMNFSSSGVAGQELYSQLELGET